jgi:tetratricopeptide (TPR) repeat protein
MEIKTAEILNKRAKDLGIKKTKAKEVALSNLIFIDFRGIRAEQTLPSEVNLSGTGANLSNRETKKNDLEPSIQKTEVAYHDYLAQTAEILQRNDFKTALQRFKTILKYYPSDDNALFYGAYCLFQTGNYQESLVYLEQLTKSNYANFEEERDWYILKCLTKLNRMLDAKRVAEKIIEQNGFYSEQARDFLTKR